MTDASSDCAGNRVSAVELNGDRTTWTYDRTYQLEHEQRSGAVAYDVAYGYDPAGNRLTQDDGATVTTYA